MAVSIMLMPASSTAFSRLSASLSLTGRPPQLSPPRKSNAPYPRMETSKPVRPSGRRGIAVTCGYPCLGCVAIVRPDTKGGLWVIIRSVGLKSEETTLAQLFRKEPPAIRLLRQLVAVSGDNTQDPRPTFEALKDQEIANQVSRITVDGDQFVGPDMLVLAIRRPWRVEVFERLLYCGLAVDES